MRYSLLILVFMLAMAVEGTAQMVYHIGRSSMMPVYFDSMSPAIDGDSIYIQGRVVESLAKRDLKNAFMIPIDSAGNLCDTIKADYSVTFIGYSARRHEHAYVRFKTVRRDSTYVFEIGCPGYTSQTVVYKAEKIGKRESMREMPVTILEREPHKLGEVEVVASKVKFYHRGDTLVYNADAFQLADGSMLDDLIRQLPGVELNHEGQIKVNGEVVETLLLNGKHFFSGDNKLMLENLGAYTVDNVEVYRGQTVAEKWADDPNAKKHLTMDVKLKKEYSVGYMLNAQGGYGTEDRYLGRLFSSWFNSSANVSLVGNINNVGSAFSPHSVYDSWNSQSGSNGDSRYQTGGLNYDIESNDWKRTAHGSVTYRGARMLNLTNSNVSTYYTDNQTHNYSYARSLSRDMSVNTSHDMTFDFGRVNLSVSALGSYSSGDGISSSLSASFNEEQANMTKEALELIYGNGTPAELAALINRSQNKSDSDSKNAMGQLMASTSYKIPGTSDILNVRLTASYNSFTSSNWNDYLINYGDNTSPADKRRQYTRTSPNRSMNMRGNLGYTARIGNVSLDCGYGYSYDNRKADARMYSLQNLADMGDYGVLPPDYQSAFDPANSYISKSLNQKHELSPSMRYRLRTSGEGSMYVSVSPVIAFTNRRLDYWRGNRDYNIRDNAFEPYGRVELTYNTSEMFSRDKVYNSLSYNYNISTGLPDLMSMVDIVDDTNPLYIKAGNPDLKRSCSHSHSFGWSIGRRVMNNFGIDYSYTSNSIVQASVYDMSTGVTRARAENVSGNNTFSIREDASFSFGKRQQFGLRPSMNVNRSHSVDLISTNGNDPVKTTADTWTFSPQLNCTWSLGGTGLLMLDCSMDNRRTKSDREGFNKINACHISYGLSGILNLPAGFQVNTSFSLYTRRGYGAKELDTTESMWNLSATYTPPGRHWLFTLNGYDLLRQVKNVRYSVTATGRSVIYTNSLPRYVMLTVQYRLNIQPKKRND